MTESSKRSGADRDQPKNPSRRQMLGNLLCGGSVLAAGAAAELSHEESILTRQLGAAEKAGDASQEPDALSGASRQYTNWAKLEDLKKKPPTAKLGNVEISRMILGGNLISGFAHSRDLLYVSDLVLAYHTKPKVFATFQLAEACGINTFLMNPGLCDIIREYHEKQGGALQFMTNCSGKTREIIMANLQKTIDYGGISCVIQGEATDRLVREGDFDTIRAGIDLARENGLPVGLAAHRLETLRACVDRDIRPDYWMKTFHHLNYWSASPGGPEHDNVFCREPDETIAFMREQPEPWIAFKVLAAGSIPPRDGFRYAFEGGADFICAGMYDFQIVDDVNICTEILDGNLERARPWRA